MSSNLVVDRIWHGVRVYLLCYQCAYSVVARVSMEVCLLAIAVAAVTTVVTRKVVALVLLFGSYSAIQRLGTLHGFACVQLYTHMSTFQPGGWNIAATQPSI